MNLLVTGSYVLLSLIISETQRVSAQVPSKPSILSIERVTEAGFQGHAIVKWRPLGQVTTYHIYYADNRGRNHEEVADGNKTEIMVPFIQPCTPYKFYMLARNAAVWSSNSDEITFQSHDNSVTHPPRKLNLTETVDGYVLKWIPSVDISHIRRYTITSMDENNATVTQNAVSYVTNALLQNIDPSKTYLTHMTAESICQGSTSSGTVRLPKTDPPSRPRSLAIVRETTYLIVKITPGSVNDTINKYRTTYIATSGDEEPIEEYTDQREVNLTRNIRSCTNYSISVVAVNRAGESEPIVTYTTTKSNDVPSIPVIENVTETDGTPTVYWNIEPDHHPILQQKIKYVAHGVGAFYEWAAGNERQVALRSAERCTSYRIQLIAENECGWSFWARAYDHLVEPTAIPDPPADVGKVIAGPLVTIEWTAAAAVTHVEEFNVYLRNEDGMAWSFWAPATATKYNFYGLPVGANYYVSMQAKNACGWSKPSEGIAI